jgi:pimeloyl-ACP methyl ester carboxylesterase
MVKKISAVALMSTLVAACNPMGNIKKEIAEEEASGRFIHYQTAHHSMRLAWSGDVKKRPVLFVHGSPGSWEAWAGFLQNSDLQKRFHILAVDRPGYGGSDRGKTERSLQIQAADIIEALKFNQSGLPAIVIGHSYGGPVIARMAADFPEKISGVIYVAASVDPELELTRWYQYPASWWPIRWLIPTDLRVCNEEIMALKEELEILLPLWSKMTSKTVVIQGEADDLVPKENYDFILRQLDKKYIVKATLVPELNHFVPWKRPELILEGIDAL